jgi:putative membrane protein
MRYVLVVLLFVIFGYALALVLANSTEVAVNLVFSQVPQMRVGLLLILTLILGILIGLLLGVQIFRVFQRGWEIGRLKKEIEQLRLQQIQAASAAAIAAKQEKPVPVISPINPAQ